MCLSLMYKLAFLRQFYFCQLHQEFVSGKSWHPSPAETRKAGQGFLWARQWLKGISLGGNASPVQCALCLQGCRIGQGGVTQAPAKQGTLPTSWGGPGLALWVHEGPDCNLENLMVVITLLAPLWFTVCLIFKHFIYPHYSSEVPFVSEIIQFFFPGISRVQFRKFRISLTKKIIPCIEGCWFHSLSGHLPSCGLDPQ